MLHAIGFWLLAIGYWLLAFGSPLILSRPRLLATLLTSYFLLPTAFSSSHLRIFASSLAHLSPLTVYCLLPAFPSPTLRAPCIIHSSFQKVPVIQKKLAYNVVTYKIVSYLSVIKT